MRKPFRGNELADKAALELGYITKEWAKIERSLDEFITLLTPLKEETISHIVIGNMDLRGKIQAVKGLAYARKFDEDWFGDMIFILDHIDNNLRPRRNDAIHAEWFSQPRRLLRRTHRTKLLRPQARQLVLETQQNVPVKLSELTTLTRDLQQTWLATLPLFFFMSDPDGHRIDPATSPTISYKQYLRWAGLGNPAKQIRERLQRRKKSSPASKRK